MQLTRGHTMKRASEFAMVRTQGSSLAGRFLVLSLCPLPRPAQETGNGEVTAPEHSRFGIITTKKLGHAVTRNLLRRRMREILRQHGGPLETGYYVVLILRKPAAEADFAALEKDFLRLLQRSMKRKPTPPATAC